MADEMSFHLWLEFGQTRGWISGVVCETHDCLPMRADEEAAFDDGYDPCVPALRVWGAQTPRLAGDEAGALAVAADEGDSANGSLRPAV